MGGGWGVGVCFLFFCWCVCLFWWVWGCFFSLGCPPRPPHASPRLWSQVSRTRA
ncbi:hypothetical protein [Streptomyces sp. SP17BM10]|uniref:hypothetical protein n=1 Tax=Streptomyces sp. SP17BM10 TaxID=3002530 RepID=UPI002E79C473|nr:hypothetical protein [Streptomyces sp. SP17BM10]